jgi:cytoskeletal protein CcmA (bactofilin family)
MFKDKPRGDLNGFLDAGSRIEGELHFEDTFRVDGKLTGKVVSKGDLVVGEGGEVDGDINVGRLFISGVVRGGVHAARRVELTAGGKLFAEVETPVLVIEEGGCFDGRAKMSAENKVRRLPVNEGTA